MAKKEITLTYDSQELPRLLINADKQPFVRYYDASARLYRDFSVGPNEDVYARQNAWLAAAATGNIPPEIAAYQISYFTAPAPYTLSFLDYRNNVSVLEGTKGVYVEFKFQTVNGNNSLIEEYVDVSYTITNNGVSVSSKATYAPGTSVKFLVDSFLKPGANSISIIATGRSTNVSSSPLVLSYHVVSIGLSSTFNISKPVEKKSDGSTPMIIEYKTWGAYDKTIEFYIDGVATSKPAFVSASQDISEDRAIVRELVLDQSLSSGRHTLQMRTKVTLAGEPFYSKTLYYEFVVTGIEQTLVLIGVTLPENTIINGTTPLVLSAVQFEEFTLKWGYYTSIVSHRTASISWNLDGSTLSTRETSVVDASNEITPDPLVFAPDSYGEFTLSAYSSRNASVALASYSINITQNPDIEEYTNGLVLKLSALGRNNDEPTAKRSAWSYGDFRTTFSNVPFTASCGWLESKYLQLQDGGQATISLQPFNYSATANGMTFEIIFETYNVTDSTHPVLEVNNGDGGTLKIYGNRAEMKSVNGAIVETQFNAKVKLHMQFVITPYQSSSEPNLMFITTNGIRERSVAYAGASDSFASTATVKIGDSTGHNGIRVYAVSFFRRAIDRDGGLNNYIINSGDITNLIDENDILTNGMLDIDKIRGKYDTVAIDGDISIFFNSEIKTGIFANVTRTCPSDPTLNWTAENATVSHPGQSTLGFSKPQLRINTNPDKGCRLYGADGKTIIDKGYLQLYAGQIPEKKARLNPNFVDSTGGNAGGFFRMVNDIYPKVIIDNEYVLINDADKYARTQYKSATGKDFPYEIQCVPEPTPVVVIWKRPEDTEWSFLSMFTLLDEKKSPRKFGQRSIYDKMLADGTPDPFDLYSGTKGNRLWDNSNCIQFELIDNTNSLCQFRATDFYAQVQISETETKYRWETAFEQEYPDTDDQTEEEQSSTRAIFFDFVEWVASCTGNQSKFDIEWKQHLDPWKCAAYYILAMKNGMVDSVVRNMEMRTDNGTIWFPIWWDTDIQKGKRNDGPLVFEPRINRQSIDTTRSTLQYCFEGHDSTLWNCLEGNSEFINTYVPKMNDAMFTAGLTSAKMMEYYGQFTGYFSERIYNESIQSKYIDEYLAGRNYLPFNMGDGSNHDLWWIYENWQYWDARTASGAYPKKYFYTRAAYAPVGTKVYFKVARSNYFAWAISDVSQILEKQKYLEAGASAYWSLPQQIGNNAPVILFASGSISEIDYHEFARYFSSALEFEGGFDEVLGSPLTKLIVGVSKTDMRSGIFNPASLTFSGINKLSALEYFDIQGLKGFTTFDTGVIESLSGLKYFYSAGSGLTSFTAADGANYTSLEFPDTLLSIKMSECTWGSIKFFDESINELTGVPSTLRSVSFTNMGSDVKVKNFVLSWLNAIDDANASFATRTLSLSNILWDNFDYEDLLLIAKIPEDQRPITGTIVLNEELNSAKIAELTELFGENTFTHGSALIISGPQSFIISGPSTVLSGATVQYNGFSFPLTEGTSSVEYRLMDDYGLAMTASRDAMNRIVYISKNVTLYSDTGVLATTESAYGTHTIHIQGIDNVSGNASTMDVSITARSYPTSNKVTGKSLITAPSNYNFAIESTPANTNGSISSYTWSIDELEGVSKSDSGTTAKNLLLRIDSVPTVATSFNIGHSAKYTNNRTINATPLIVTLMLEQFILRQADNKRVFDVFYAAGLVKKNPGNMTNVEAFDVTELPNISTGMRGITEQFHFDELKYFGNLVSMNMSGSSGLIHINTTTHQAERATIDATLMAKLATVVLTGVPCDINFAENIPLTTLALEDPRWVKLQGVNTLAASGTTVANARYLNSIDMVNTGNRSFGVFAKLMANCYPNSIVATSDAPSYIYQNDALKWWISRSPSYASSGTIKWTLVSGSGLTVSEDGQLTITADDLINTVTIKAYIAEQPSIYKQFTLPAYCGLLMDKSISGTLQIVASNGNVLLPYCKFSGSSKITIGCTNGSGMTQQVVVDENKETVLYSAGGSTSVSKTIEFSETVTSHSYVYIRTGTSKANFPYFYIHDDTNGTYIFKGYLIQ